MNNITYKTKLILSFLAQIALCVLVIYGHSLGHITILAVFVIDVTMLSPLAKYAADLKATTGSLPRMWRRNGVPLIMGYLILGLVMLNILSGLIGLMIAWVGVSLSFVSKMISIPKEGLP